MVEGGGRLRPMTWGSVGGIMQQGGTLIGSARSEAFRQLEGRLAAARNLITAGIDSLVVIGGDGSLTGASLLQQEWPDLVAELLARGDIDALTAQKRSRLTVVGLVGSIDNDMFGTDMTMEGGVGKILDADLSEQDRARVLGGNFQVILDRRAVA